MRRPPLDRKRRPHYSYLEDGDTDDELGGEHGAVQPEQEHTLNAITTPSGSDSAVRSSPVEDHSQGDEMLDSGVPALTVKEAPRPYHRLMQIRFANRLAEYERPRETIREELPLNGDSHLAELQKLLDDTFEWQYALFLDVTQDRKGRVLGIPILSQDFHHKVFGTGWSETRLPWAILEVYPARGDTSARLSWLAYLSHEESQYIDLVRKFTKSKDGKPLTDFIKHGI